MSRRSKRRKRDRGTPQHKRWLVRLLVTIVLIIGVSATAAWRWQLQSVSVVAPPTINSHGVDVEVVDVIKQCQLRVADAPRDARAWGELGMTFLAHEFDTQAAICFEQAEKLDSSEFRWPYYWAQCVDSTFPRDAVSHLERAVAICGSSPPTPRLKLIELLLELHELDAAEQHLSAILSSSPSNPRARLAQGRLLFMREDFERCLAHLQRLDQDTTDKDSRKRTLRLLIAEVLRRTGRNEEAQAMRDQATRATNRKWPDPLMDDVKDRETGLKSYLVRADILYGRRAYEEAIALLTSTVQAYPESVWAKMRLARVLIRTSSDRPAAEKQRQLAEAESLLRTTLELDASSVEALYRLGVVKAYQGEMSEAIECYEQAVRLKSDFTMAYYNLGSLRRRTGDTEGAIEALEAAVATEPDFADAHYQLSRCYVNAHRYVDAERHLEIANRLVPNQPKVLQLYEKVRRLRFIMED